jgi:hypothetical protein
MCSNLWPQLLDSLLPPVAALLSAIALRVAAKARITSSDARQTSQAALTLSLMPPATPPDSEWDEGAPDRRKS